MIGLELIDFFIVIDIVMNDLKFKFRDNIIIEFEFYLED